MIQQDVDSSMVCVNLELCVFHFICHVYILHTWELKLYFQFSFSHLEEFVVIASVRILTHAACFILKMERCPRPTRRRCWLWLADRPKALKERCNRRTCSHDDRGAYFFGEQHHSLHSPTSFICSVVRRSKVPCVHYRRNWLSFPCCQVWNICLIQTKVDIWWGP